MHTSGNSSTDTSLILDVYCGPEVLFETCVAMKIVDDDDISLCTNACSICDVSTILLSHYSISPPLLNLPVSYAYHSYFLVSQKFLEIFGIVRVRDFSTQ